MQSKNLELSVGDFVVYKSFDAYRTIMRGRITRSTLLNAPGAYLPIIRLPDGEFHYIHRSQIISLEEKLVS